MDSDRKQTKVSLVLLSIPATLIFFFLPLFLGAATNTFAFSEKQIGVLASSDLIGLTIASASAVFWVRLFNWRYTMLAGLLVAIVGNIVSVHLNEHASLVAMRILCGIAGGAIFSVCIAYFTDARQTQRIFGIAVATQTVVAAALIFGITTVTSTLEFDGICYLFAGVSLALIPALYYVPARGKNRPKHAGGRFILAPATILTALAMTVFFTGTYALWAYAERIGVAGGLDSRFIGTALGIGVGAGFTGSLAAAWVDGRFGRMLPTALLVLVHLATVALLWRGETALVFALAVTLLRFFTNFAIPTIFGLFAATDTTGRGTVLYNFSLGISAALGPIFGSAIVDYDASFGLLYVFSATAAICTIGLIYRVNAQLA